MELLDASIKLMAILTCVFLVTELFIMLTDLLRK